MHIASIDIGTNTVLLLIVDHNAETGRLTPLCHIHHIPRLGKGVGETGKISREKIDALITILREFRKKAEEFSCEIILASGTYPFRAAKNALEVISEVNDKIGIHIRALPGEEEAQCSFLGAVSDTEFSDNLCVIDIGGGSTELITGTTKEIEYRNSVPFGVVNMTEKLIKEYPVTPEFLVSIRNEIQTTLQANYAIPTQPEKAIAIAGTPTTLACMLQKLTNYDEEKIHRSTLTQAAVDALILQLASLTPIQVKETFSAIVSGREDVLLMGALLLSEIMTFLKLPQVEVSSHGLRYGAIYHWLQTINEI
jgi:exopolyphosphatase/guanosine-5'-triphosphate,3'-diphosphate pyrophosphatase